MKDEETFILPTSDQGGARRYDGGFAERIQKSASNSDAGVMRSAVVPARKMS